MMKPFGLERHTCPGPNTTNTNLYEGGMNVTAVTDAQALYAEDKELFLDDREQQAPSQSIVDAVSSLQDDHEPSFTEDDLVELELLRDEEIDAMIDAELLSHTERWNIDRRDRFTFAFTEMILDIHTGVEYPVAPLSYEVTNLSLPNIVVDDLRKTLRDIFYSESASNTYEAWIDRHSVGCFAFQMTALHITKQTYEHLQTYRADSTWKKHRTKSLQRTDYELSQMRKEALVRYGVHAEPDCVEIRGKGQQNDSIFNPDWSKKLTDMTEEQKLAFSESLTQSQITESMFGVDAGTIQGHELANLILGITPRDICARIPAFFRILHVESVIRKDLASKFQRYQIDIRRRLAKVPVTELQGCLKRETRSKLGKRKDDKEMVLDLLVEPILSFHCTPDHLIPSIVRHGFLKPQGECESRCGSTYGMGIYSSPDPYFSLMYTYFRGQPSTVGGFAGLKLIACATVMGACRYVTRDDGWWDQTEPMPGATSHVANDGKEYVVFNQAQIIPVYIVHLDLGRDVAHYLAAQPDYRTYIHKESVKHCVSWAEENTRVTADLAPGDKQRAKMALMAKARKYFPYGFGAATGSNFRVLEVGEISEDDEEYGQYQGDARCEGTQTESYIDVWASDDHLTFAVDQPAVSDTVDEEPANADDGPVNCSDSGNTEEIKADWESCLGPAGKTKFDEFYQARNAKAKKATTPKSWSHH